MDHEAVYEHIWGKIKLGAPFEIGCFKLGFCQRKIKQILARIDWNWNERLFITTFSGLKVFEG